MSIEDVDDVLQYYQIFRNVVRYEDDNKYVIFITDANNPSTREEAKQFEEKFGKRDHVKFKTWQTLAPSYPFKGDAEKTPYQFVALKPACAGDE